MNLTAAPPPPALRGCEWLVQPQLAASVFTPERATDEHRLIGQTVTTFLNKEVLPVLDRLERKDWALARRLLQRCGELGLLGVDVADSDGGTRVDTALSMVVSERMSPSASFGATFGAQVNLAILPVALFGTDLQKRQYLPGLLSGDLVGAYCLSESGSGSDALAAKTYATRRSDGGFALNGEKAWTTNGGFADVFIVFAKVDGEHFTAFIVDRGLSGVTGGREEHKLGLHGSSTTTVTFQDVIVPATNLLGEIGKGHKIAFNVLNLARLKLGSTCGGCAQVAIGEAVRYGMQRRQFGQPIASFGAIKHKISEMVVRAYAVESLNYRTAGLIDTRIEASGRGPHPAVVLAAFDEYAIEASIAKVAGSEMLDFVLDENIQIHGGNGFVRGYPAERHYRDARVNRIFEGTNEINRLLIPGLFARRATASKWPIEETLEAARRDLVSPAAAPNLDGVVLGDESGSVELLKKLTFVVLGNAVEKYGQRISSEQEVLMFAADMMIDVYAAESALLRATAAVESQSPRASLQADVARVCVNDATLRVAAAARQALAAMEDDDTLPAMLDVLGRMARTPPLNTVPIRRRIADEAIRRRGYPAM
jgi:alkylation response protein AidB-like acyl-CoA dehydrogenase